jgi:bloom syndrome protein
VFHLREAGISCAFLSATMSYEEQCETIDTMRADPPGVKIVFVTPEKVAQSDKLMRLFDNLHERGLLVRFLHYQHHLRE